MKNFLFLAFVALLVSSNVDARDITPNEARLRAVEFAETASPRYDFGDTDSSRGMIIIGARDLPGVLLKKLNMRGVLAKYLTGPYYFLLSRAQYCMEDSHIYLAINKQTGKIDYLLNTPIEE